MKSNNKHEGSTMSTGYNDDHIVELTELEALRKRPMLNGKIELDGVFHLLQEVFANSIDEFIAGFGNEIDVYINNTIDSRGPRFRIEDRGRGIPQGKLVRILTKMNTSGKMGDIAGAEKSGYPVSGGVNGIGITMVTAVSRDLVAISTRDGESHKVKFDMGVQIGDVEIVKVDKKLTGTIIEWTPDVEVMRLVDITSRASEYRNFVEVQSMVTPGVKINFKWDNGRVEHYYHPNGVVDYYEKESRKRSIKTIGKPVHFKWFNDKHTVGYNIVLGFTGRGAGSISYVNGIYTKDGGEHVKSLTEALGTLTAHLNKGNYIPKSMANKIKISGSEIADSMFAIIVADQQHAEYTGQQKSYFNSKEYRPTTVPVLKNEISKWISSDPTTIDKIGEHCAKLAKLRYETSKLKDAIIKSGSSKTDLFKTIDVKKFSDCNKNDPERTEIFLCEGDSAASSVKDGRNRDYQAVFALRGKVKNVVKKSDLSEELMTLVKILGIGKDDTKDISKLRYKRIIIITDADVDGYHISSLLIAFFHIHYPELIENGNVFIAKPPLYTMNAKGNSIYINNHDQLNRLLNDKCMKVFKGITPENTDIPDYVFKYYIQNLVDYSKLLDEFAHRLTLNPIILEAIAMDFKNIMKGNTKSLKVYGFDCTKFDIEEGGVRKLNIDKEYEHFYIQIDRTFKENIIDPIVDFIKNKIQLCRIRLVGRNTGTIYSGIYYEQGKLIHNTLFGNNSGMEVTRSKGLGANSEEELRVTSMDTKTRYIIQLKSTDKFYTDTWIENLFTNSTAKKEMFLVKGEM